MKTFWVTILAFLGLATTAPAQEVGDEETYPVSFYLYFPDEAHALPVIELLTKKGFKVTSRLSADGDEWLLMPLKTMTLKQMYAADRELAELILPYEGNFDGHEVQVSGPEE